MYTKPRMLLHSDQTGSELQGLCSFHRTRSCSSVIAVCRQPKHRNYNLLPASQKQKGKLKPCTRCTTPPHWWHSWMQQVTRELMRSSVSPSSVSRQELRAVDLLLGVYDVIPLYILFIYCFIYFSGMVYKHAQQELCSAAACSWPSCRTLHFFYIPAGFLCPFGF